MSTPDQATVNAEATAALTALKDAANNAFIASADIVIAEQAALGRFAVKLPVARPASLMDIANYYIALGYGCYYGPCPNWGEDFPEWPGLWSYPYSSFYPNFYICRCKEICNITISWKNGI